MVRTSVRDATARTIGASLPAAWYDSAALMDADYAGSRFYFDGVEQASKAAFHTAVGGVAESGLQRSFAPYLGANPNLVTNGAFDTDLSGWTPTQNGASSATRDATGYAKLTSDGTTGSGMGGAGLGQPIATTPGDAILVTLDVISATLATRMGGTALNAAGNNNGNLSPGVGKRMSFKAPAASSFISIARTGAGTGGFDNVVGKVAVPLKGFVQGGVTARVRSTTPAAASGIKVLLALGDISDAGTYGIDRIELLYDATGRLRVQVVAGGTTQADLDLGAVAGNTAFDVVFVARANGFRASLNGGVPVSDTAGSMPSFCALFLGRSNNGTNVWDGGDCRVQIWASGTDETFYSKIPNSIHAEGDSFMAGANGVVLPSTLQTSAGRAVLNTGVGGATATNIKDRLVALSASAKGMTTIIWDGSENPITTVAEVPGYLDELAAGIAALGHSRFVLIPACANSQETRMDVVDAVTAQMKARWPANVLDWRDFLTLVAPGSYPADSMFVNLPTDQTHLSQAAMDLMASAVKNFISGKGW